MGMKPLLILAPMRAEMSRYESVLQTQTTLAHRPLFSGTVGGFPVSVLNTGMGLTNTVIALSAALDGLDPCAVLSQGTAGAHTEELRVGDIVCADAFVYGDSRKGGEILPVEVLGKTVTSLPAHPHFVELGQKHGLAVGTVMSGYAWNTDPALIRRCHALYGSLCEEMEDAAAAQLCLERGIPHGSLRVISNNHLREDGGYDLSCADTLQEVILSLIANGECHL